METTNEVVHATHRSLEKKYQTPALPTNIPNPANFPASPFLATALMVRFETDR
jgi:hypothetical protein